MHSAERKLFNQPCFEGKELVYTAGAVRNVHVSGDGPFTNRSRAYPERRMGAHKVSLTTSWTDAQGPVECLGEGLITVQDCPVTENVSDQLLRLPFCNELSEADPGRMIAVITAFEAD